LTPVIVAEHLRKSFRTSKGPVEAVAGVSMSVERGEILGFLGPNGAGKTTTLRMLTTLLPIDVGTAAVAGYDVGSQAVRVRSRIGYVSQLGGADSMATGRENLVLQGRLYGGRPRVVAARAAEVIEVLELSDFADRRVSTYSGGQRRRLDVALGIVHKPEVLFLDEPTTGLDPQNRVHLWEQVRGLRDLGTTVFLTTHYLEEADELCDRVLIMDHGKIVAEGSPRSLKQDVAGDMVLLGVKDSHDLDRLVPLLLQQPYVREAAADQDAVRMYVHNGSEALAQLVRLLDSENIGIKAITMSEPTLDDVFLRQTGRSLRDTADNTKIEAVAA
jgi:ABC-2 type transport system ATP-binding protein